MSPFESIFAFLFKYRPLVFEKGRLAFGASWPLAAVALAVAVVIVAIAVSYTRARPRTRRERGLLVGLRSAALLLLAFCLMRPMLLLPTVVPQENFVGVLIDDSRSMQIADYQDRPRSDFVAQQFGAPDSALRAALDERFMLRFFRFSDLTERIDEPAALANLGGVTDLSQGLAAARRELAAVPLAGLILITDGADNASSSLSETLLELRSRGVPVYPVGLGAERFARDIELGPVELPRRVLQGSSLVVDLTLRHRGYGGERVRVDIEDSGRIVASREVRLGDDGEATVARVQFTIEEPGIRHISFRVPPLAGEAVAENNEREALLMALDRREKVLYLEGEPRFEVGFTRRAVAEDTNLQLVTLIRTAENKFYRLGVDDADELAGGFPRTREELFAYRGLVVGSVEASFFTHDQLQMIEEYVGQRGGGLLVLGGRNALERGGYVGTPLESLLPVVLPGGAESTPDAFFAELQVTPTRAGAAHPATQIAGDPEESARRWSELPPVSAVNRIAEVKPGGVTLLEGRSETLDEPLVVLAYQRYGRGRALALPLQDVWTWQMHADMPLEDQTHETFWRQLLRWLVSYTPDRIDLTTSADRVGVGDDVEITARVQDGTFLNINNAAVRTEITGPGGRTFELPLDWVVDADGEYRGRFTSRERGLYRIEVVASDGGERLGSQTTYVESADLPTEYFGAEMRAALLRQIAEETGGRFYTPETVATLPEDISITESGTTVIEEKDLWDMPIVLLALLALVGGEWLYRRQRGLV